MSTHQAKTQQSNNKSKKQLQKKQKKKPKQQKKYKKNKTYSQESGSVVRRQWAAKQVSDSVPVPFAKTLVNQLKLEVPFEMPALNLGMVGFLSYLISKGCHVNNINQGLPTPWSTIYNGVAFMYQGIVSEIGGAISVLTRRPVIVDELIAALASTEVKSMRYGKISYSWQGLTTPLGIQNVPNGDGIWAPTAPLIDNELYNSPAALIAATLPTQQAYSDLLKIIGGLGATKRLAVVDAGKSPYYPSLLKDPSAFSRVYRYNGLNPTETSGYYKNIENEGRINNIIYGNFCSYVTPDTRVPINFAKSSGDACLATAWGLHSTFTSPNNMSPVQFKLVDFEEIYYVMGVWAAKAKEKLQISVINDDPNAVTQFTFSQQDFRIILRQALMNVFDTQYFAQFTGPIRDYNTIDENAFVPFMVSGGTYGSDVFDQFLMPDLLKEIINALRARNILIPGKSPVNTPTLVPILGRWRLDTPATFQYDLGGVTTDLFATLVQDPIILTDGRIGPNDYVNLNSAYYRGVLANWNSFVSACVGVTTPYSAILSDGGPTGLGTLHYTRVQQSYEDEFHRGPVPTQGVYVRSMRYVKNSGIIPPKKEEVTTNLKMLTKASSKTNVKAVPPARIVTLSNTISSTSIPLTSTHEEFFNLIITPSVRLNITDEDALTCQMYQTEVRELLSLFHTRFPPNTGADMASKLTNLANLCFTGAGHDTSNVYAMIMQELQDRSKAGFLAQLLAGFVKQVVPGADGIIDTVASLVPI